MKNLLYILIAVSLLASCKKDDPMPISKTYTGKLVADCNMVPMANSPIKVFIREPQSFGSNTLIESFSTDANGNFMGPVPLSGGGMSRGRVNHLQMRNCSETDAALRKIYEGDGLNMPAFFRLHKW